VAEIKTFACDICKTQKKDANHWWVVFQTYPENNHNGIMLLPWETEKVFLADAETTIHPTVSKADAHLCGVDCVTKWLSQNLFSREHEKQKTTP
jgi:hypothetical protein